MNSRPIFAAASLCLALFLAATLAARADTVVTFAVTNGTLQSVFDQSTGTFTGTFTFDTTTSLFTSGSFNFGPLGTADVLDTGEPADYLSLSGPDVFHFTVQGSGTDLSFVKGDLIADSGAEVYYVTGATITAEVPAATPEPASLFLLGTGVIGSVGFARRRLRSRA